jgi:aminopeptidase N
VMPPTRRSGPWGGAFWQHGQDALLAPYVGRYLDVLPRLWTDLSPQLAAALTAHLFPSTLVVPDVLARVAGYLERDDLPPGMRRVLLEQHDDLARAFRAQSAR